MDRESKIEYLDDLIKLAAAYSTLEDFVARLKQDEREMTQLDDKKLRYLADVVRFSTIYKSLDDFVSGLKGVQQDTIEAKEKETCRAKIAEVLGTMNNIQPGANVHTYNKAKMYLDIELSKGLEEGYLAYLTKQAIDTKVYARLKKYMQFFW